MTRSVVVKTGARLHFGFLACKPEAGREFGGAGVMIDSPGFEIAVRASSEFAYCGPDYWRDRALSMASRFVASAAVEIEVLSEIPPHAGLGSGTQFGLAVAKGISLLDGDNSESVESLALRACRGARSAIGIHGFARGGFLVDAGKLPGEAIGSLAAREEFPAEWRFVLVKPRVHWALSGQQEREAFAALPPMPRQTTDHLRRIVNAEMLPGVRERNVECFGEALYSFGRIVGQYFAPVQGETYSNDSMAELVSHLRKSGIRGVGQTSWGPTIFALVPRQADAEKLAHDIERDARWSGLCRVLIAAAKNDPASVQIITNPKELPSGREPV